MKRQDIVKLCVVFIFGFLLLFNCNKSQEMDKYSRRELNLSMAEKISDYDFFWEFIHTTYPFSDVVKRNGVDLDKLKEEYYKKLENMDSKAEYATFYGDLCHDITDGKFTGHLSVVSSEAYNASYKASYPCRTLHSAENKLIKDFYSVSFTGSCKLGIFKDTQNITGVQTSIIEKGKIACIRIDSFHVDSKTMRKQFVKIRKFLKETKNYKHLIFDITRNGGGYPNYWGFLVAYLSYKNITYSKYGLYTESENTDNRTYITRLFKSRNVEKIEIDSLPENLKTDLKNGKVNHNKACKKTNTVYKAKNSKKYFNKDKKIWVLVSKKTYSAADNFAGFCRQTGFAKVIGENTGGSGMSPLAPLPIPLPYSGLLILFDSTYALNTEGQCNMEFGTAPDVYNKSGKVAMQTCLEEIKKLEKEN